MKIVSLVYRFEKSPQLDKPDIPFKNQVSAVVQSLGFHASLLEARPTLILPRKTRFHRVQEIGPAGDPAYFGTRPGAEAS